MTDKEDYEKAMLESGLKMTIRRELVYHILYHAEFPIDVESIYKKLIHEKINLSTVYRTLESFVAKGIVKKGNLGNTSVATYELNRKEHKHHIVCVKCHQVVTLSGCPLEQYVKHLRETSGFEILEHKLEIQGMCPSCKNKDC
jgi:Fur family ferric uptake transcriptional regulator